MRHFLAFTRSNRNFRRLKRGCVLNCSVVSDSCVTPWTVAHQAPLSLGFSRQEHWSGLPFSPPGHLPDPGIEPSSPALAGRFLSTEPPGKPTREAEYF